MIVLKVIVVLFAAWLGFEDPDPTPEPAVIVNCDAPGVQCTDADRNAWQHHGKH